VNGNSHPRQRVLVVADESANWKVAGLRQLERLLLGINEDDARLKPPRESEVSIRWGEQVPESERRLPQHQRLLNMRLLTDHGDEGGPYDLVINTRTVPYRRSLGEADGSEDFAKSDYLGSYDEIPKIERRLLASTAAVDDGAVSKYFDRHISRAVTRWLLKFPITPNACSAGIAFLSLLGFLFLLRGSYWGFVTGMALYETQSVLDGCDGEIARVKYLESESGRRFDAFCDLGGTLLLVLGLGVGLFRQNFGAVSWIYLSEGILALALIATQLAITHYHQVSFGEIARHAFDEVSQPATPDAQQLQHEPSASAAHSSRPDVLSLLDELSRRDLSHLVFLLLALLGLTSWILHILFVFPLGHFVLTLKGLSRFRALPRRADAAFD